ncbi:hypothetical protein GCM10023151_07690 [Kangiella marina]|uniref:Uncharacterized protein n=1 Tax=Kangiella marina TaxID=1079178 RepID=A0ABP8IGK8_9GAMM
MKPKNIRARKQIEGRATAHTAPEIVVTTNVETDKASTAERMMIVSVTEVTVVKRTVMIVESIALVITTVAVMFLMIAIVIMIVTATVTMTVRVINIATIGTIILEPIQAMSIT